jgi:hypothetical protein
MVSSHYIIYPYQLTHTETHTDKSIVYTFMANTHIIGNGVYNNSFHSINVITHLDQH